MSDIEDVLAQLRAFVAERDWAQFHSPKNLAMALSVEAAELLENFQWLTEDESRDLSPEKRAEVAEEIADVFIYLLLLSVKLDIDPIDEVRRKILKNAAKYPADLVRGCAEKPDSIRAKGSDGQ